VDWQRDDYLGRKCDEQQLFEHWREIQSHHEQLGGDEHHERAFWSISAHRGLDRQ
jgi:hypothetical protein